MFTSLISLMNYSFLLRNRITVCGSWKVQPKFFKFVVCNLYQSSPSWSVFRSLWFIIVSSVFFYLNKSSFSSSVNLKGDFSCGQNNWKYRDWQTLMLFCLVSDPFFRYSCNRYDEKDAQAARDAQAVSTAACIQLRWSFGKRTLSQDNHFIISFRNHGKPWSGTYSTVIATWIMPRVPSLKPRWDNEESTLFKMLISLFAASVRFAVGGGGAEWVRPLNLKSGGPGFKTSTLPLSGFVLGSPEFNSTTARCVNGQPVSLSPVRIPKSLQYVFFAIYVIIVSSAVLNTFHTRIIIKLITLLTFMLLLCFSPLSLWSYRTL